MDAYTDLLDKYRFNTEWTYVGSGQNGTVYKKGNGVIKITTDEVELQHAQKVEGKQYPSLAPISDLDIKEENLGTYKMPLLKPVPSTVKSSVDKSYLEITKFIESGDQSEIDNLTPSLQKFFHQVRKDFQSSGIPLDETDIQGDNIMVDSKDKLKLIDY